MSEIQDIAAQLRSIHDGDAWHGPSLHEALKGVTPTQAAARPIANAHCIWELALHIAGWENVFDSRLRGQPMSEPPEGDFPPVPAVSAAAWRDAIGHLDHTHEKLLATVAALSDNQLEQKIPGSKNTYRFLLHGIVRHHVYHTGQIALLAKQKA
jgi:uncharacterized damage-inducible protein DinB